MSSHAQGLQAGREGKTRADNPYSSGMDHSFWEAGWEQGDRECRVEVQRKERELKQAGEQERKFYAAWDAHLLTTGGVTKFANTHSQSSGDEYKRAFRAGWEAGRDQSR